MMVNIFLDLENQQNVKTQKGELRPSYDRLIFLQVSCKEEEVTKLHSGDIEKMKKKTCDKPEKKKSQVKCNICDHVFVNKHRLDLHIKRMV